MIDFNGGKDPKAVLLHIHPPQSQHQVQESHNQGQQHKHHQDQSINDQSATVSNVYGIC